MATYRCNLCGAGFRLAVHPTNCPMCGTAVADDAQPVRVEHRCSGLENAGAKIFTWDDGVGLVFVIGRPAHQGPGLDGVSHCPYCGVRLEAPEVLAVAR